MVAVDGRFDWKRRIVLQMLMYGSRWGVPLTLLLEVEGGSSLENRIL